MNRGITIFRTRWVRPLIATAITALPVLSAAQTTQPTPFLLQQLSDQTQTLHQQMASSIVRVHVPEQINPEELPGEQLLRKWEPRLDPAVRQKLVEQVYASRSLSVNAAVDDPFTFLRIVNEHRPNGLIVIRPFDVSELAGQMPLGLLAVPQSRHGLPRTLGIVLDERGLLLVPAFVDRAAATAQPVRITLISGHQTQASFVGSDRQTNLTLLRLPAPTGKPVTFAMNKPADGSLVMIFAPQTNVARLAVWTGGLHENGVVVLPDGRVAGFANSGQFLSARAAVPIIHQLAEQGVVRRASVGIKVSEVRADDPRRQALVSLGNQPAIHVDRVSANSAAAMSGLQAGDYILSVGEESVSDLPTFAALIAARSGPTDMRVLRDGQIAIVSVQLTRK